MTVYVASYLSDILLNTCSDNQLAVGLPFYLIYIYILILLLAIYLTFDLTFTLTVYVTAYLTGTLFAIVSDILSGTLSGISSDIFSGIPSGILSSILSGILSGRYSGIVLGIFLGSYSHNLQPRICSTQACPTASGARYRVQVMFPLQQLTLEFRSRHAASGACDRVRVQAWPTASGACTHSHDQLAEGEGWEKAEEKEEEEEEEEEGKKKGRRREEEWVAACVKIVKQYKPRLSPIRPAWAENLVRMGHFYMMASCMGTHHHHHHHHHRHHQHHHDHHHHHHQHHHHHHHQPRT